MLLLHPVYDRLNPLIRIGARRIHPRGHDTMVNKSGGHRSRIPMRQIIVVHVVQRHFRTLPIIPLPFRFNQCTVHFIVRT